MKEAEKLKEMMPDDESQSQNGKILSKNLSKFILSYDIVVSGKRHVIKRLLSHMY